MKKAKKNYIFKKKVPHNFMYQLQNLIKNYSAKIKRIEDCINFKTICYLMIEMENKMAAHLMKFRI